MTKFYLSLLCITFTYFIQTDDHQEPVFEESIPLFKDCDLFEQLKVEEELEKIEPKVSQEQINLLKSIFTAKKIKEATGRQVPDIGHDAQRKIVYTSTSTKPTHIVLTFSGEESLENSIKSLQKNRLAHNFIIGVDGKIYPVTKEGESLEDALSHRPFAVGVSGKVVDGKYEERDMNALSITISVIGKDNKPATQEQEEALAKVISWLSKKFEIQPYNVVDYGTIALPYGRRNTQENLPWEKLAKKGLVVWPQLPATPNSDIEPIICISATQMVKISCALRKIGFLCPITYDPYDKDFQGVVKTFQKHYKCSEQSGFMTIETHKKLTNIIEQMEQLNPDFENIHPTADELSPKKFRNIVSK